MMRKTSSEGWLCRNCNSLVGSDINTCPYCQADRPDEADTECSKEYSDEVVHVENYTNARPEVKSKYNFREAVLVNAADILLVLGLFCTFGALLLPIFLDDVEYIKMWSIGGAVVLFAISMIQWAVMRTLAFISQHLRNQKSNDKD
ncbi:MAG: hypothetical protein IKA81_01590 [Alistipes sp.]|nr:hypothetical protein [Alistipes sp.]